MKKLIPISVVALALLAGLGPTYLSADDMVLQKTGYFREVAAARETLDFNGHKNTQYRDVFDVPEGYGRLITITAGGEGVILWFQNDKGEIRNVSIPVAAPLIVLRKGQVSIEPGMGG